MKKLFALLAFCACLTPGLLAQDAPLDTLLQKFKKHREAVLQEKIYAHLDRTFYLTGETLWFSLYTVEGALHKPADVSKVAYVEILDKANFPILQAKIELENGTGHGSFFLPASLNSTPYKFRAYTSWMKNFSPEFYFHQNIAIVNPFITPEATDNTATRTFSAAFFPEGGNLVSGIQTRIAFRITDETGKGVSCRGMISDSRGDTLVTFAPAKFGLGSFMFTPAENETYSVILIDAQGRRQTQPLPKIYPSGYVLQLKDSGEFLQVNVRSKGAGDGPVYLFVHARQIIAHARRETLRDNEAIFVVRKKDLVDGISHFTLFNDHLAPVCERLYFTYPGKALDIAVGSNQKSFGPRKKVTLSLETKGISGEAHASNLSMSVYKLDSLSGGSPTNIYPYLWLGSDLSGEIESPDYYFDAPKKVSEELMDNLMLTHGWRRFDWKDVLGNNRSFGFLPETRNHIITGIVSENGMAKQGVFTHLGSPGPIIRAYGSWSNVRGEVRFEVKDFYGPRRIIVQTQSDSSERHEVKILNPFADRFAAGKLPPLILNKNFANDILSRSIAMQVQDIYYYDEYANRIIEPLIDSSAFYGKADATYLLDDYTRFPVMEEVMREYVPGVFVRKRRDGFHFLVIDEVRGGILNGSPMVLLDGVAVPDVDNIMSMDPLKIRKLEVVKRQYFLGQSVFSGIVSYTTYKGDLGGMEFDPSTVSLNYDGLQLKREFYSPQYSRQQETDRKPDQRYLLYWHPAITTDDHGKSQVEFFTSDVPGRYLVVIQGLSGEGYSGTKQFTFSVSAQDQP
jgi:hypothetical protein